MTAGSLMQPDAAPVPGDATALERERVIADTINTVFHEFAAALDDTDRAITNAADEDFDDYTEMFRAWRVSLDIAMARKTTWDSFLASHRSLSTAGNRPTAIANFNADGTAQRAAGDDDFEDFVALATRAGRGSAPTSRR